MSAPPEPAEAATDVEQIQTLVDTVEGGASPALTPELRQVYGGDLRFPAIEGRPYVVGNFVSTLDGVVSFGIPGRAGGSEISGANKADHFIMGLLRASADAVVIGSGTLHATDPEHLWTADHINPEAAGSYAEYRRKLVGSTAPPLAVVVTASGRLHLDRTVFRTSGIRALIITTPHGSDELCRAGVKNLPETQVEVVGASNDLISPAAILAHLHTEHGVRLLLHEGGPQLFGQFMAQDLIDELFLTLAPQIAGRSTEMPRPALVQETVFLPESAPWLRIVSVKRNGSHLYLRYRHTAGGIR